MRNKEQTFLGTQVIASTCHELSMIFVAIELTTVAIPGSCLVSIAAWDWTIRPVGPIIFATFATSHWYFNFFVLDIKHLGSILNPDISTQKWLVLVWVFYFFGILVRVASKSIANFKKANLTLYLPSCFRFCWSFENNKINFWLRDTLHPESTKYSAPFFVPNTVDKICSFWTK